MITDRIAIENYEDIFISENIERIKMLQWKPEGMCQYLTTALMLAMNPLLVKGVIIEEKYILSRANCDFSDNFTSYFVPTLVMCSLLCTSSVICTSFVWNQQVCSLLNICPRICDSGNLGDRGWNVYCPEGIPPRCKLNRYLDLAAIKDGKMK